MVYTSPECCARSIWRCPKGCPAVLAAGACLRHQSIRSSDALRPQGIESRRLGRVSPLALSPTLTRLYRRGDGADLHDPDRTLRVILSGQEERRLHVASIQGGRTGSSSYEKFLFTKIGPRPVLAASHERWILASGLQVSSNEKTEGSLHRGEREF